MSKDLMKKAIGNLSKKVVEKALIDVNDIGEKILISLDVPVLNILASGKINGGIPINHSAYVATPKAMGKTTLTFKYLAKMQKKFNKIAVYVETEGRFNKELALKCGVNLDKDKFILIHSNRIDIIQESLVQLLEHLSREEQEMFSIGYDSWGAMVSTKHVENVLDGDSTKKDLAKFGARNDLAKLILGYNTTVFVCGWTHTDIGSMGTTRAIGGGIGMEFMPDTILHGTSESKSHKGVKNATASADEQSTITGKIVTYKTTKASAGGMEDTILKVRILKDGGIDPFWGLLDDALAHGCVEKSGNRFINKLLGDEKKYWEKDIYNADFWIPIWRDDSFNKFIEKKYSYDGKDMIINTFDLDSVLG